MLITEAGGVVTGLDGEAHAPGDAAIVATNGWIHEEVLTMLKG